MSKTLYLIDGHAQIFRSYYAVRSPMTSPITGEPTNAVYIFTGMLFKLFEQFRPHYVVMAIDTPGKTFRDELYPDYKANRDKPPEELVAQIDRIFEVTRLFGIPTLGHDGSEADDVIATVTHRVLENPDLQDVNIRIVTKDKDMEQLLGDRVTMFDIHTDTTIDVDSLKENKQISPDQVIDVLALTGDTADNIPGVEKIGPKTAAKLINEFGSIDGMLANLDKIKGKRRENIEKARDFLPLARQLVTLKNDLDVPFSMDDAKVATVDAGKLKHVFKELGFRRHITDLDRLLGTSRSAANNPKKTEDPGTGGTSGGSSGGEGFAATLFDSPAPAPGLTAESSNDGDDPETSFTTATDYQYTAITTESQIDDLVATLRSQKMISVDTETVGLGHRAGLCGICIAWESGSAVYIPMLSPRPEEHLSPDTVLEKLRPILEDPDLPKCGHNIKYDLLVLRHAGVTMTGVVFDTMIAAFLLGLPGRSLDDLALSQLGHDTIRISELIGPRSPRGSAGRSGKGSGGQKTMDQVPLELITPYAAEDADITFRLYESLAPRLDDNGMQALSRDVEMPLIEVLTEMQTHGIRVEPQVLTEQKDALAQRITELKEEFARLVQDDTNIDSPKQLADVMFNKMGLPVVKRTKTGPSTDNEVLEKLCDRDDLTPDQIAIPKLIIAYRQLAKLVNTYLDNLKDSIDPKTARVHATFNQSGAATGRLSSTGPNLQNIPIRTEVGRQIRRAFVADPGPPPHRLISADYSQIELRILAHLSEDEGLVEAFKNDMDIHTAVAAQVFGVDPDQVTKEQRGHAKTINFGIIYGVTAYGLARRIDNLDVAGAKVLITDYRQRFPGIDRFLGQCVAQAIDLGYVTTILGRRREIPQIRSTNGNTRSLGERLAINTVVQGSAADLIKVAMVRLHHRIQKEQLPLKLLLQIHDELVTESPSDHTQPMAEIIRHEMENAMTLTVPLKVDIGIGPDWFTTK